MEIKTKHNIGDRVYFMYDNHIKCGTITSMKVEVESQYDNTCIIHSSTTIMYNIQGIGHKYENKLFSSKEELINSL